MPVNAANVNEKDSNCAMCAIAGVLERDTHFVQPLVGANDALQATWNINAEAEKLFIQSSTEKIWRLIYIELRKSIDPWIGYRSGSGYSQLKDAEGLKQWMSQFSANARYAIWGCGEMNGLYAHWNCAYKTDDSTLKFVDYQYNYNNAPARTSDCFIAPSDDDVTDKDYKKFLCFAYTKTPVKGIG